MQHKISDPRGSITLPFVFHHRHREKRKIGHRPTRTHTDTHGHTRTFYPADMAWQKQRAPKIYPLLCPPVDKVFCLCKSVRVCG
ncbi:MAG: hypothetical protein JRF20_08895 [Deltaproteobacteria bacterium]|nr:hypothetical protein [Deltaproteobacteria bacterium]